jgi:hypothetical protein
MPGLIRKPSPLRIVYWIVMLSAIGALLWHLKGMMALYEPMKP